MSGDAPVKIYINIKNKQKEAAFGRLERELVSRAAVAAYECGAGVAAVVRGRGAHRVAKSARMRGENARISGEKAMMRSESALMHGENTRMRGENAWMSSEKARMNGENVRGRNAVEISIMLIDDAGIKALNFSSRGVDEATDVLSFPLQESTNAKIARDAQLGDIVLSPGRIRGQAAEYGNTYEEELCFLTIHGVLHLLGYDHAPGGEAEMDAMSALACVKIGHSRPPRSTAANVTVTAAEAGEGHRAGFVAVLGRPNVGKSTLINTLCGNNLSIVTNKPQTTRRNARMILTSQSYQIIFVDTPGLHLPKNRLGEQMVRRAKGAIKDVDAIILMIDARDKVLGKDDRDALAIADASKIPVVLIINKIDLVKKESLLPLMSQAGAQYGFSSIVPVRATGPDARAPVLDEIVKLMPAGGPLYPEDMITDQTERRLAEDIIREAALKLLSDEVPHGVDVEAESYRLRERDGLYEIRATLYCEKESHKKIIIGKNGETLKRIGASARIELERLQGAKVFLALWVKTRKDWRNDEAVLRRMGYYAP